VTDPARHFRTVMLTALPRTAGALLRSGLGLLLVCSLVACPAPDPGDEVCSFGVVPQSVEPWQPAIVGRESELLLPLSLPIRCDGTRIQPTDVTVHVTDARTQAVEATVELDLDIAKVRFTPSAPGVHRVVALFEPRGGRTQLDVPVAADRSGEAVWELDLPCERLVSLSGDAVLCDGLLVREGVAVGAPLGLEPGSSGGLTTSADGLLWHWSKDRLRVWRDEGAGPLVPIVDAQLDSLEGAERDHCLAAQGRRAFVRVERAFEGGPALRLFELGADDALLPERQRTALPVTEWAACALEGDDAIVADVPLDLFGDSTLLLHPFEEGLRPNATIPIPGIIVELQGRDVISALPLSAAAGPAFGLRVERFDAAGALSHRAGLLVPNYIWLLSARRSLHLAMDSHRPESIQPWVLTLRDRALDLEHFFDDPTWSAFATRYHVWSSTLSSTRIRKR
jgi:hypothetical protein